MNVRSLSTAEELQRYVDFGEEVYRNNPNWVPPDAHHLTGLLKGEGGFGSDTQIQAFWVEENDRVLATVAAVTSETYNQHWNEQMGHLLFFEALPDQDEAVESLMRAASDWLRRTPRLMRSVPPAVTGGSRTFDVAPNMRSVPPRGSGWVSHS